MAEVEHSLSAMWNIRVNTMVKKVERQTHGVAVTISDRATNIEKKRHSDQVVPTISSKAIGQVFEPRRWLVSQSKSTDVGIFIHSDRRAVEYLKFPTPQVIKAEKSKWLLNPTAELRWMRDSEVLTVRTRACDNGKAHTTQATQQSVFFKIHWNITLKQRSRRYILPYRSHVRFQPRTQEALGVSGREDSKRWVY